MKPSRLFVAFPIVIFGYIKTTGNISAIIHLMNNLLLLSMRLIKRIDVMVVRALFPSQVHRSPIHRIIIEHICDDVKKAKKEVVRSQENNLGTSRQGSVRERLSA